MTTLAQAHPTVEAYAKKYPGVPLEVILKEDLLRRGGLYQQLHDMQMRRVPHHPRSGLAVTQDGAGERRA